MFNTICLIHVYFIVYRITEKKTGRFTPVLVKNSLPLHSIILDSFSNICERKEKTTYFYNEQFRQKKMAPKNPAGSCANFLEEMECKLEQSVE